MSPDTRRFMRSLHSNNVTAELIIDDVQPRRRRVGSTRRTNKRKANAHVGYSNVEKASIATQRDTREKMFFDSTHTRRRRQRSLSCSFSPSIYTSQMSDRTRTHTRRERESAQTNEMTRRVCYMPPLPTSPFTTVERVDGAADTVGYLRPTTRA